MYLFYSIIDREKREEVRGEEERWDISQKKSWV
jgi:hypothetical protein